MTVWGEPQLPLRGVVEEEFIAQALKQIPEREEWRITGLDRVVCGAASWYRTDEGMSLAELASELPEYGGERIALGIEPVWSENGGMEVSAVVPYPDGRVDTGIY